MAVQKRTAMCKMNNSKKALLRALRGIRSFAHAILFFCKHYFKMCGISVLYTCQEINDKFLFRIQKSFNHTPDFFSSLLCLCGKRNHQCPFFYLQSLFDGFDLFLHLASLDLI